jgi:four helix bundle protein
LGQDTTYGVADFRKLEVWRKAHALAISVYRVSGKMRGRDTTSLRAQIVRAAMSVPANIVEGRAHKSDKEFSRFLRIALSSATELEYHLVLGSDVGAIGQPDFESLLAQVIDVKKMLTGLINRLAQKPRPAEAESK